MLIDAVRPLSPITTHRAISVYLQRIDQCLSFALANLTNPDESHPDTLGTLPALTLPVLPSCWIMADDPHHEGVIRFAAGMAAF
jgi:hypothetical protein